MSTNTATQAASTSTATVTETADQAVATTEATATAAPAATATATTSSAPAKKQKLTDRIVSALRGLEDGQLMTIDQIWTTLSGSTAVKKETLQATLSQLVKAKRVEKVNTQKRQPGYKAAK